jgi:hypothetical protein
MKDFWLIEAISDVRRSDQSFARRPGHRALVLARADSVHWLRNIIVESTGFGPLIRRKPAVGPILLPGAICRGLNRALT